MTVSIFLILLVFAASIWYLGSPFFSAAFSTPVIRESELRKNDLSLKKTEILESLKDLELDHETQKLSDADFKELYAESFKEGTEILRRLDQSDVQTAPTGQGPQFCAQCGGKLSVNARFCSQCGEKVAHV